MANQTAEQGKLSPFRLRFNFWLNMDKSAEELIADKIEGLKKDRSFTSTIRDGIRLVCDLREGKLDVLFELFPWVRAEFLEYMRDIAPTQTQNDSRNRPHPNQSDSHNHAQTNQQIESERAWLEAEQERIKQERAWEEHRLEEAKQALEVERQKVEEERKRIEAERQQNQSAIQKQLTRMEELLLQQGNQLIDRPAVGLKAESDSIGGAGLKGVKTKMTFAPPTFDDDDDIPELTISKAKSDGSATQNFLNSLRALQEQ